MTAWLIALFQQIRPIFVRINSAIPKMRARKVILHLQMRPAQLLIVSFAAIIFVGTILLTIPVATRDGHGTSWIDALFTATSATCVTGLIVQDTPKYFSAFGQLVILFLIQVGGIGIMTITTSMGLMLGRRMSIREQRAMQDIMEEANVADLTQTVLSVVKLTILVELIGALLLLFRWAPGEETFSEALYLAAFHAISAFCNAGFSLFSDSFVRYSGDTLINFCIAALIILGGLGFTVMSSVIQYCKQNAIPHFIIRLRRLYHKLHHRRASTSQYAKYPIRASISLSKRALPIFTVHTRLSLLITGLLIAIGTILTFFFEYDHMLLNLSLKDKILAAYFQSVTLRTTGFNTINISGLMPFTLFFMVIFMFIGASPGSTGGGIKTSTLGVLLLSIRAMLLGRENAEVYGRTIPQQIVYKAISIVMISLLLLVFFFMLLLLVERQQPFLNLFFEATSAFGTVGLSTGVTPDLSVMGKLIIICLMFAGRTGPFTLAVAVGERTDKSAITYPECKIIVG